MKFNWFKRKNNKLSIDFEDVKYYCDKCNKELSFDMYNSKKCFWCDAKTKKAIAIKEINNTPTSINGLNKVIIEGNYNSLLNFYKRKEQIENESKKQKNYKKNS